MTNDAELISLSAQYCHRFDDGEIDALLALFEADATVEFGGQLATGHDQLATFFTAIRAATTGGRHLCVNHEIAVDGETATGISDFMVVRADGKPPVIGRYDDTYRNGGDRWRFTTRVITVLA
jgi:hypothetical protein